MILHCTKCHHEAQSVGPTQDCDWCGAPMKPIGSDYMSEMPSPPSERDDLRDQLTKARDFIHDAREAFRSAVEELPAVADWFHDEATEALCAIDAALQGKDPAPPVQKGTR